MLTWEQLEAEGRKVWRAVYLETIRDPKIWMNVNGNYPIEKANAAKSTYIDNFRHGVTHADSTALNTIDLIMLQTTKALFQLEASMIVSGQGDITKLSITPRGQATWREILHHLSRVGIMRTSVPAKYWHQADDHIGIMLEAEDGEVVRLGYGNVTLESSSVTVRDVAGIIIELNLVNNHVFR